MSSFAQPLKLSDLEAFGKGTPAVTSPVSGKPLTLADLEAYGSSSAQSHPLDPTRNAIHNWWDEISQGPGNLVGVGKGLAGLATGDTEKSMLSQNGDLWQKTKDSFDKGDVAGTLGHVLNYALNGIPGMGIGSKMEEKGEQFQRGDISGGIGGTLGLLTNLAMLAKAPEAIEAAPGAARAVASAPSKVISAVTKVDPDIALTQALKPRPAGPDFIDSLPRARADIKQAEVSAAQHPAATEPIHFNPMTADPEVAPNNLISTIQRAKAGAMSALDTFIKPLRDSGAQLDGNKVADTMEAEIPTGLKVEARINPDAASQIQAIRDQASGLRQPLTIDEVHDMLRETNAQLNSLYHGTPDAQSAKLAAAGGQAMLEAKARGLRQIFYDAAGPEAADLNKRWGIMDNHEAAAQARRVPTVTGESSPSALDAVMKFGKAVTHLDPIAIQEALGRTDHLVRKAYENTKPGGAYPTYQPPNIAGLLEAAPTVTPAPADTSFVRGQKAAPPQRVGFGQQLQLGAPAKPAIVTPAPADTSFVRGAPAMTEPPNPARALPPATTRFSGSGPDTSGLEVFNAAREIARDPKTGRLFRYYTSGKAPRPLTPAELATVKNK